LAKSSQLGMKLAKTMKKSDEFIPAFSALNDEIVLAIKNRNFARVILLDKQRQELIKDLVIIAEEKVDNKLFNFLELCTRQNTKMIEDMELELERFTYMNNRFNKAITAYKN
jgi:hypothetical protein